MSKVLALIFAFIFAPISALAQPVCPVCTVAVAGGVGLFRYLGISDLISGVWIGALMLALVLWTIIWLNKKNIRFKFRKIIIFVSFYILVILPLYWVDIMGHPDNKFLGMDKLLFGIIVGTLVFGLALIFERYLRVKNAQKAYFPFQKVVVPVSFLAILSLIIYFLIKQ